MPRTIALVFAHPDDETFATGGTLAKYSAEGVRIVLYSATDGGAGKTSGIPVSAERTLGDFRRDELAAACAVLGVEPPVIAAHGDGRLGEADPRVVIDEIVGFLREHTPDVVITFGPEGAPTGHRDHKAISQLVTPACRDAGVPRLCYVTWPDPAPGELYQILGTRVDISVDVSEFLPRKREAFLAHASQRQHQAAFEQWSMLPVEHYHVALGKPAPPGATDLFA